MKTHTHTYGLASKHKEEKEGRTEKFQVSEPRRRGKKQVMKKQSKRRGYL